MQTGRTFVSYTRGADIMNFCGLRIFAPTRLSSMVVTRCSAMIRMLSGRLQADVDSLDTLFEDVCHSSWGLAVLRAVSCDVVFCPIAVTPPVKSGALNGTWFEMIFKLNLALYCTFSSYARIME